MKNIKDIFAFCIYALPNFPQNKKRSKWKIPPQVTDICLLANSATPPHSPSLAPALRSYASHPPPFATSEFKNQSAEVLRTVSAVTLVKAEDEGFEPSKAFTLLPFQGSALGHYANPPCKTL